MYFGPRLKPQRTQELEAPAKQGGVVKPHGVVFQDGSDEPTVSRLDIMEVELDLFGARDLEELSSRMF
jgi:hypothetical protein